VKPRAKPRYRYTRIERPERGVAVADVVNDATGEVRRFRFVRQADDSVDVEEIDLA
jgi:hypothetical protein